MILYDLKSVIQIANNYLGFFIILFDFTFHGIILAFSDCYLAAAHLDLWLDFAADYQAYFSNFAGWRPRCRTIALLDAGFFTLVLDRLAAPDSTNHFLLDFATGTAALVANIHAQCKPNQRISMLGYIAKKSANS